MFRRKPKGRTIIFDPYCGDKEAAAVGAAMQAGNWKPFVDACAGADGRRREFLVQTVGEIIDQPTMQRWLDAQPRSALAGVVHGHHLIKSAWAIRGRAYANQVNREAWNPFHDGLRHAEAVLLASIDLEDDGLAWSLLLHSGRGLGVGVEELRRRYASALRAAPQLIYPHDRLIQGLCRKWAGSHSMMFEFAREVTAPLGQGDPRHRLIPTAHFEYALDFRDDVNGRNAYLRDPRARQEIAAAADKASLRLGAPLSVHDHVTRNWFALTLSFFGMPQQARPLLAAIGNTPTKSPWDIFLADPEASLVAYRKDAGLPDL